MAHSLDPPQFAVLIIEDDPLLLLDAVDMVEQAGFVAYEARNADQAIRLLERQSDIRLIFTDVEMPGEMDGLKLARAVRDRWPPVWIIVVSGHGAVTLADVPEGGQFFAKPYAHEAVIAAMKVCASCTPM